MNKFFKHYDIDLNPSHTGFRAILTTDSYGGGRWEFFARTESEAVAQAKEAAARDWSVAMADRVLYSLHPTLAQSRLVFPLAKAIAGVAAVVLFAKCAIEGFLVKVGEIKKVERKFLI